MSDTPVRVAFVADGQLVGTAVEQRRTERDRKRFAFSLADRAERVGTVRDEMEQRMRLTIESQAFQTVEGAVPWLRPGDWLVYLDDEAGDEAEIFKQAHGDINVMVLTDARLSGVVYLPKTWASDETLCGIFTDR